MTRQYELTPVLRIVNRLMIALVRLGLGPRRTHLLTVRGRKSGREYTTPVSLVMDGERRWLVAPYGEVGWVKNARAAGQVTLARGGRRETLRIHPAAPAEAAPVLKAYVAREPITQPYFDAQPDAPLSAFEAEADRHPVFLLVG